MTKFNKPPKFKVGDIVTMPPNLFNETEGEITEVCKLLREVFSFDENQFDPDGLDIIESTIKDIKLPYSYDGRVLIITHPAESISLTDGGKLFRPERIMKYKARTYCCTVKSPRLSTLISEGNLKLKEIKK